MSVAVVHDYLTQRGGAERVALSLSRMFDAPIYTSLYDRRATFPEFENVDVRVSPLNHLRPLRRSHRVALPLLAPTFSRFRVDADVVICSSSGWAHGAQTDGLKIVYCHTPARWLYQPDRYVSRDALRLAFAPLRRALIRWDQRAAASAHAYVANSSVVQGRIHAAYGKNAAVVPPPHDVLPSGPSEPLLGVAPGFALCVSRLLPYKNVEAVVEAFRHLPTERLVLVGAGPLARRLQRISPPNVQLAGRVTDAELRWLYQHSTVLLAASFEDFGLTPLEAAAYGKPSAVLRWGGYLDTVRDGVTGLFFDQPTPAEIAEGVRRALSSRWSDSSIRNHASLFSETRFRSEMSAIIGALQ